MKLGIVLAISDYGHQDNNLPGCVKDGEAIANIFQSDSSFEDVLILASKTESGAVKSQLIEFINKHKENDVSEVVFYYTGHGDFVDNEFYFLLSDYNPAHKKQTSLENTELDNLLRALGADVTVKIVDACHSGKAYIKDSDAFDKFLNKTKVSFDKCYFMYSSQVDQYSYQDDSLSYFTESIINAIRGHQANSIRYKDIIDYVSDSFISNKEQTPFFVVQADFTEQFCNVTSELKQKLGSFFSVEEKVSESPKYTSMLEKIKADAERYCSQEEAYQILSNLVEQFGSYKFAGDVVELFSFQVTQNKDKAEKSIAIGNWLKDTEHNFFARPTMRTVTREKKVLDHKEPSNTTVDHIYPRWLTGGSSLNLKSHWLTSSNLTSSSELKIVSYDEKEVSGYEITIDQPIKLIEINAEPKFPNLNRAQAYIVPLMSKTELRIFYSFTHFTEIGWGEQARSGRLKWSTKSIELKRVVGSELAFGVVESFVQFLLEPLIEKYEVKNSALVVESSENEEPKA
ncbi:hypothetical protein CGI39_23330 [Vibrio parahaemolyticus]|uniref:caspase family protein n=7 Tax=Vibrio parahaemolyticus TaxID=670 RepID=UPI0011207866|nr:caspase family protein [Vibrio parahaemolyticus]EGS6501039.1 caspase family protein [Vibrio parahaemolyticus]ELA3127193.1 caspase family protein [Vibrio parahaemolyticus]ELF4880046.1 caspase family protein [Vibrio parahaemolyticus]MCG6435635.1 caspase family protein [Vibrio parahaemolyticus]MDF4592958.1 caspase family protein [Vibrio parahaemolyticus]